MAPKGSAQVHLNTHQLLASALRTSTRLLYLLSLSLFLRCAIINDDPGCLTQTVKCWGMEGRFINFYKSSDQAGFIVLCEVEVYGGRNPVHHYIIIRGGWSAIGQILLVLYCITGRACY